MRFFLKKKKTAIMKRRRSRKQLKRLIFLYSKIKHKLATFYTDLNFYFTNFYVTLPKRQQHFLIYDLKQTKTIVFSSGQFLSIFGRRAKFFKRNPKNIAGLTLQLKNSYEDLLSRIYFFSLKNFNYRQYSFFWKFTDILKPRILYFLHKMSYIPRFLPKRRIKRRVLRLLNNQ